MSDLGTGVEVTRARRRKRVRRHSDTPKVTGAARRAFASRPCTAVVTHPFRQTFPSAWQGANSSGVASIIVLSAFLRHVFFQNLHTHTHACTLHSGSAQQVEGVEEWAKEGSPNIDYSGSTPLSRDISEEQAPLPHSHCRGRRRSSSPRSKTLRERIQVQLREWRDASEGCGCIVAWMQRAVRWGRRHLPVCHIRGRASSSTRPPSSHLVKHERGLGMLDVVSGPWRSTWRPASRWAPSDSGDFGLSLLPSLDPAIAWEEVLQCSLTMFLVWSAAWT